MSPRYPPPRTSPLDPPPMLAEFRRHSPIARVTLWDGRTAWLVTRFADARAVLRDARFSADASDPNFPSLNPSQVVPNDRGGPARMAEPRHAEIRAMVADRFTTRAVEAWRPLATQIAAEQLDQLLAGGPPADLVTGYAVPVPLRLICRILGVPAEDMPFVQRQSLLAITRAAESGRPALGAIREYVQGLVRAKEHEPGDDLVSQLVRRQLRPGRLRRDELVDLSLVLLVAGHATTASTISLGALSLLEQPVRFRQIRENPTLLRSTVDELLRFHTVTADGAPRVATEDVTVGGTLIRAGDAVVVSLVSANRDESTFECPDTFDIRRDARQQLGFGYGGHRCLGQQLARLEIQVAFATLARRVPTLRLATPTAAPRVRSETFQHGIHELRVSW
jgi:cytochrome P450